MRDDEPPGAPTRVDEHEDDEFTRASLDPPRAAPSRVTTIMAALSAALPARGARRALTLGATALLVVVVVVELFTHVASNPGGAMGALLRLPTQTPAATFVPGANVIYFSDGVPWGSLTIDGKRILQADLSGDSIIAIRGLMVTRGAHQLVYQARYFPSVHCVFSAPQAQSDTCRLDTSGDANQFLLDKAPLARVIDLGANITTLQPDQFTAILQLASTQLQAQSATTTIAPGERYLDDHGQVVVASAPLQFAMTLALGYANGVSNPNCAPICLESTLTSDPALWGDRWPINVTIAVSWTITDSSGRRLVSSTDQGGQIYAAPYSAEAGIQLTSTGWQLTWLDNVPALAVENAASTAANPAVNQAGQRSYGMSYMLALNPLNGCVMDVDDGTGSMRVFWRFGALLAVDRIAHSVLPTLPVANAQEQAAASNIVLGQK